MFSSLGFDSKNSSRARDPRNDPRNNSKYVMEVPRGFSVHVFKSPSPPAYPAQTGAAKADYLQSRPQNGQTWKAPSNTYSQRPDPTRKPSFGSWNTDLDYDHALEMDRSKLAKPYGIFPGPVPDMYIYERSISSASDLPGSPSSSSSSSSDTDYADAASTFTVEVSSIRASSSTETLEATAAPGLNADATATGRSPYGQSARNPPTSSRAPVVPPGVVQPRAGSISSMGQVPITLPDDDEGTVVDAYDTRRMPGGMNPPPSTPANTRPPGLTPSRRNSDDRTPRNMQPPRADVPLSRGSSQSRSRSASPTEYGVDGDPSLRAPPGLQFVAPTQPASHPHPHPHHRATISLPIQQRPSAPSPEVALSRVVSNPEGMAAANMKRSVRWTENLICPSPVPPEQRRKGWYNRRGDQLWTNDGMYKSAEPGQEYPPDLACYPEPNAGWMNEEGTRIDMQHRLIPKPPLRPALKRPRSSTTSPEHIKINTPGNTP